ncbi:hypothetical protein EVAR_3190_1 [Eumeta japonica]|uniref:Uncharacterized protein n=1 Tax=Eumeta variegata TaxID=151549 RepID=A0A4C1SVG4_EUMVA|nr:hypothetical protein EVAR_3190_1 [Eumeta japonica]
MDKILKNRNRGNNEHCSRGGPGMGSVSKLGLVANDTGNKGIETETEIEDGKCVRTAIAKQLYPRGFARVNTVCVRSCFILNEFAVNPNLVPAYDSSPSVVSNFNFGHAFDFNSGSTLCFDPGRVRSKRWRCTFRDRLRVDYSHLQEKKNCYVSSGSSRGETPYLALSLIDRLRRVRGERAGQPSESKRSPLAMDIRNSREITNALPASWEEIKFRMEKDRVDGRGSVGGSNRISLF